MNNENNKNNSNVTLRKAHKLLRRIVKKLGRPDAAFSAQIAVNSSRDANLVTYGAYISSPAEGLAPITFGAVDKDEFLERLKDFLDNKISEEQVARAFHEAQIFEMERAIDFHKTQIEKIDNPEPQEAELVDESAPDDNGSEKSE